VSCNIFHKLVDWHGIIIISSPPDCVLFHFQANIWLPFHSAWSLEIRIFIYDQYYIFKAES